MCALQVVRVCAKAREAVGSPVEHLTLHYQVGRGLGGDQGRGVCDAGRRCLHPAPAHPNARLAHATPAPQVANLSLPGADLFRKLQLLKGEKGGLSAADERQFITLRRWAGGRAG